MSCALALDAGCILYPKDDKIMGLGCGTELNLTDLRRQIEAVTKKEVVRCKDQDRSEPCREGPAYGEFQVLLNELDSRVTVHYGVSPDELNAINELREIVEASTPPLVTSISGS